MRENKSTCTACGKCVKHRHDKSRYKVMMIRIKEIKTQTVSAVKSFPNTRNTIVMFASCE